VSKIHPVWILIFKWMTLKCDWYAWYLNYIKVTKLPYLFNMCHLFLQNVFHFQRNFTLPCRSWNKIFWNNIYRQIPEYSCIHVFWQILVCFKFSLFKKTKYVILQLLLKIWISLMIAAVKNFKMFILFFLLSFTDVKYGKQNNESTNKRTN
jgi:hypothetical protein